MIGFPKTDFLDANKTRAHDLRHNPRMRPQVKTLTKQDFKQMSDAQLIDANRTFAYRPLAARELKDREIDAARIVRERHPFPETQQSDRCSSRGGAEP